MNAEEKSRLRQKIDAGLKSAVAAALEGHRRAGRLVAVLRAGRVVLAPPESAGALDVIALREGPPKPWPGAWVAQRRLRHKCSKGSYQFVFWLIVLGHQFAAFDSFQDWQLSRAGLKWMEQTSGRRQ